MALTAMRAGGMVRSFSLCSPGEGGAFIMPGAKAMARRQKAVPAMAKCGRGARDRDAARPPSAAPSMPPMLNMAWKRDMVGRPMACSTSTPWTFMATSMVPASAP